MKKLAIFLAVFGVASSAHAEIPRFIGKRIENYFRKSAAKQDGRAFHKVGQAYRATVTNPDGSTKEAIVRVSRGANGLSLAGRNALGLAVKIKEANGKEQDLNLISSFRARGIGSRILTFTKSLAGHAASTLTSFKIGEQKGAITTTLPAAFRTPEDATPSAAVGDQSFELTLNQKKLFRRRVETPVANVTVHFDQPLNAEESAGLQFNPTVNTAGGIQPLGWLNKLRPSAYRGSEEGRGLKPVE